MGRLTRFEKRNLGILPRDIFARGRELIGAGVMTPPMTLREGAMAIATDCMSDERCAGEWIKIQAEPGAPDLDEILAFIEGVLELLAKFLPIFRDIF